MTEQSKDRTTLEDVPNAVVKKKRQFSIVWLIPLVAALIGAWLAYKTISEKGPTITLTFANAEGLEAGKTKIKYKTWRSARSNPSSSAKSHGSVPIQRCT